MRLDNFLSEGTTENIDEFSVIERTYGEKDGLSIGLANIHAKVPDIEYNKDKIARAVDIFKQKGVNMVVFPEFCLAGYFWDNTPEEPEEGEGLEAKEAKGDPECWKYMDEGVVDKHWDWVKSDLESKLDDDFQFIIFNNIRKGPSGGKKYWNSTYVINKQFNYKDPKWMYDKTFLPGIEKTYTISGITDRLVLDTRWGRLGFSTCYDFCISQIYQEMAQIDNVDACVQIASWRGSSERNYPGMNVFTDNYYGDLWDMLMDGTAARNQMWIISTNAVGIHGISEARFWGGSGLWSPSGLKLLQGSHSKDELLVVHNVDIKGEVNFEKEDFDYSTDFGLIYKILQGKRAFTRIK